MPNFFINLNSTKKLACYPYGNSFHLLIQRSITWLASLKTLKKICLFLGRPSLIFTANKVKLILCIFSCKSSSIGSFCLLLKVRSLHLKDNFYIIIKRQLKPRIFFHTRLQLRAKLLCYLCTVRVPRPFNQSPGRIHLLSRYRTLCFC